VNNKGQLATSDAALDRLAFAADGSLRVAGNTNIAGAVTVGNFPATQNVAATNPLPVRDQRGTVLVNEQSATAQLGFATFQQRITVSAYERIRLTVSRTAGDCTSTVVEVLTFESNVGQLMDRLVFPTDCNLALSQVYDLPGSELQVRLYGAYRVDSAFANPTFRLVVHGY
jgi:hypothetical protein